MSSVNKFYPINIQNANNITGTYGSVSLLVNANEETKGSTILKHVGINRNVDASYNLAVNGDTSILGRTDISGSLYVNGVQITGSGGGGGSQDLSSVLLYGNVASTGIDMSNNDIINVDNLQVTTINGMVPSFTSVGLADVLTISNKANTFIDMSINDISGVHDLGVAGNINLIGNFDICGNAVFHSNLDSYGNTYVEKLVFSNISSDISVLNWDASIPSYPTGGEYIAYTGSGTSTDISGFTMDAAFDYTAGIVSQNFNPDYYTTYYPVASNQAFFFNPTNNTEMTIKSVNYNLEVGEYLFGFYCQSSNTGGNGLTITASIKNSSTNAVIEQQENINPVASFPNWVFIKIPFVITTAGNHYFEFANLPNGYIYGAYILITGIEITLTNAIVVKDTNTGKTATIGGSQSIINQLYVNDGLKINDGGIQITGGFNSATTYGIDNTTLNTILGENPAQAPSQNVAIGSGCMQTADTATQQNVAIGVANTQFYTNVKNSVSIGYGAQVISNAERCVVVGSNQTIRGIDSVAIGAFRYPYLAGCISSYCVSVGSDSLGGAVSNGYGTLNNEYSTSIGYKSQFYTADKFNTSVGAIALYNLAGVNGVGGGLTTQYNTAIGYGAGYSYQYNNCTFLGSQTDTEFNGLSNSTAIGYQTIVSESNCIQLGSHGEKVKISGDLDGVTTINGTAYPPSSTQSLSDVLAVGNSAGIYDIDMSGNAIYHVGNILNPFGSLTVATTGSLTLQGVTGILLNGNIANDLDMSNNNILRVNDLSTNTINSYQIAYKNVNTVFTATQSFRAINIVGNYNLTFGAGTGIVTQAAGGTGTNIFKPSKFFGDVDMSGNNILNVNNINLTNINGSPYTGGGSTPSLSAVLAVGNSAGTYSINMNSNSISACNNLGVTTINSNTPAYANASNTFSAVNTFEGNMTVRDMNMQSGYTFSQGGSATIQQTGITGINTLKACYIKGDLDVSGNVTISADKTLTYKGYLYLTAQDGGSIIANGATGIGLSNFGIDNARGISTIASSQVNLGTGSTMSIGGGTIYNCGTITVSTVQSTTTYAKKIAVDTNNISGSVFDVCGNVYFHDGTVYITRGGGSLASDGTIRINYLDPATMIEYNFLSEALVPANLSLGAYTPNVNQIGTGYTTRYGVVSIGKSANANLTTGQYNTSVGYLAGQNITTGSSNTCIGYGAGDSATYSPGMSNCTFVGTAADPGAASLSYATAIGAGSVVTTSNTVQLGRTTDTVNIPGLLNINDAFKPVNTYLALSANTSYATSTTFLGKKLVIISNTATTNTITIPNVAVGNGYELVIANTSNTACVISSNANLNGKFGSGTTTMTLYQGVTLTMYCNGTNWIIFGYTGLAQQIVYRQTASVTVPSGAITVPQWNATNNITWAGRTLTQASGVFTNSTGYDLTLACSVTYTWGMKANSATSDATTVNANGNRSVWYLHSNTTTYPKFLGTNNFNTLHPTNTTSNSTAGMYFNNYTYQTAVTNFILKNGEDFRPQIFQTNAISNGGSTQVYLVATTQLDAANLTITILP